MRLSCQRRAERWFGLREVAAPPGAQGGHGSISPGCSHVLGCALLSSDLLFFALLSSALLPAGDSHLQPSLSSPGVQEQQVVPLSSSHLPSLGIRRSTVYSRYSRQALRDVPEMKPHTESV